MSADKPTTPPYPLPGNRRVGVLVGLGTLVIEQPATSSRRLQRVPLLLAGRAQHDQGAAQAGDTMTSEGRVCSRCQRSAVWQVVTDGEHPDAFACGRHVHAVLLSVTDHWWAKVDRVQTEDGTE